MAKRIPKLDGCISLSKGLCNPCMPLSWLKLPFEVSKRVIQLNGKIYKNISVTGLAKWRNTHWPKQVFTLNRSLRVILFFLGPYLSNCVPCPESRKHFIRYKWKLMNRSNLYWHLLATSLISSGCLGRRFPFWWPFINNSIERCPVHV